MHAWDEFVRKIEQELGKNTVERWVKPLKIDRFDARNLYLIADDPIHIAWFEEHIRPRLKQAGLFNNNHRPIQVYITSPSRIETDKAKKTEASFTIYPERLDPEFTFDHFIVSEQNMVAYQLLTEIDRPAFNPVYVYGPKYAGKTHLLTASALYLQSKGKKAFYVRAETFTSHVVQAIRLGQMNLFRNIYREIDALFIDGIDALSKKDATQEEFFHTFNVLQTLNKPIVLSASCPPSKLTDIEPRLISRFEWGISIGIEPAQALAILQQKALLWKLPYPQEILSYIAKQFPKNPVLALQALALRAKAVHSLDAQKAAMLLKDLEEKEKKEEISPDKIISSIATHYGLQAEDILGKSQAREHAYPRQIAMFLCREKLKLPFQKIGAIFGRDHSTVMAGVKQIQKWQEEKKQELNADLERIEQRL